MQAHILMRKNKVYTFLSCLFTGLIFGIIVKLLANSEIYSIFAYALGHATAMLFSTNKTIVNSSPPKNEKPRNK